HHLGAVTLLARLVLPLACLQLALEIDRAPLGQVLLGDLAQALVEDHDTVPLGALAVLAAGAVAPALRGGDRQMHDLGAVLSRAPLRVATEITHQNHLVDAPGHDLLHRSCALDPHPSTRHRATHQHAANL